MSIKIVFETKRRCDEDPYFLYTDEKVDKAQGSMCGYEVIVENTASMAYLMNNGFYGYYIGQRMNFYNQTCFPDPPPTEPDVSGDLNLDEVSRPGVDWLISLNIASQSRLYLSPEEVIYLAKNDRLEVTGMTLDELWNFYSQRSGVAFKRRYKVYESLRDQGWTVRSGINFSGEFSIYKTSPKFCHASAVVQIASDIKANNNVQTIAMRRHLKNVKKALLIVTVNLNGGQTWDSVRYDSDVQIEIYHSKTPLLARKVEFFGKRS